MIAQMYYWGTNQSILQRVFAAKSLKEGQKGMLFAAFVKFLIPVIVVLPGIIAWHYFDGQLANPDQAYPALVKEVLPGAFVGFFAAVLFGAVLSSFNSLLNSSATLFGFDLFKQFFNKNATELQSVKAGKNFGFGLGLVSMTISPFIIFAPDGLFSYIQQSLGSMSVPILAVVLVGMFTKTVPAIAAKRVMIGGVLTYLTSLLFLEPYFRGKAMVEAKANGITDVSQLSILEAQAYPHFLHVMGIIFAVSVAYMLFMGKVRPQKTPYEPKITDAIDVTPWKYTIVAAIIISILVLSTYFIF